VQERKGNEKSRKSACLYIAPNPQLKQEGPHDLVAPPSPLIIIHAHTSTRINIETEAAKEQKKKKKQGKKIKRRAWQGGFRVTSDLGFYDALHHALHAAAAAAVFAKKLKKKKDLSS
jgi:hypothetical protein